MGLLDSVLQDDAYFAADTDGFAEAITYTPVGGAPRTVNALVWRNPPEPDTQSPGQGNVRNVIIEIPYHATNGATSIDRGGDSFSVPLNYGGSAVAMKVTKIIESTPGFWRLQLR